jgi:hypothetical protein
LRARPPRRYTDAELDKLYALYDAEEIRGATPRHWEDVRVGDALPRMAKGPMTATGFIAFAQGWGGLYIRANKLALRQIRNHPALGIKNRFGIPDCPERVHWEPEFAHQVGAPGAYDYGPERCSWLTHQLTNWMGDSGFLVRAHCKLRRHNPEGDLITIDGRVTAKRVENGRHLVDIEQEARNPRTANFLSLAAVRLRCRRGTRDIAKRIGPIAGKSQGGLRATVSAPEAPRHRATWPLATCTRAVGARGSVGQAESATLLIVETPS